MGKQGSRSRPRPHSAAAPAWGSRVGQSVERSPCTDFCNPVNRRRTRTHDNRSSPGEHRVPHRKRHRLWLLLFCLALPGAGLANIPQDPSLINQRNRFQEAEKALRRGHLKTFRRLERSLRDYPLHVYLEYAELYRRLDPSPPEEVLAFLRRHADTPLAERLQRRWLYSLARQGSWQRLVDHFTPTDSKRLLCHYARGLVETGQPERAWAVMEGLWQTGRSLPRQCDWPLSAWRQAGKLDTPLVWKRIRLAMRRGNVRLVRHLTGDLPADQRYWVKIWFKVRRDPAFVMEVNDHFIGRERPAVLDWITVYGLQRQARRNPLEAARLWQRLRERHAIDPTERERIERRLALALLKSREPEARSLIERLDLADTDERVITLHVFSAIQDQDWDTALAWLERLSLASQHTDKWRYWRGRVLEGMGRLEEARAIYVMNGESRGYYSFLAADRAGYRYQFAHAPLRYTAAELADIEKLPAILRARELLAIRRPVDARREWNHAIERLDTPALLRAAKLADAWGWHDRAIATAARARYWDDLELRFPLAHQKQVLREARRQQVDPAWAFAIIRQESAFTPDARSDAGALGLMQLLPRTARSMARSMRLRRPRYRDLLDSDTNIRLGIRYLKQVRDRYDGHPVLATAAYNAGARNVRRWLPVAGNVPADVWIETVPFRETRDYLQRVLTYTVIYEQRLGREPVPLLQRMQPIPGTGTATARKNATGNRKRG